jgi:hypothetical protein
MTSEVPSISVYKKQYSSVYKKHYSSVYKKHYSSPNNNVFEQQ